MSRVTKPFIAAPAAAASASEFSLSQQQIQLASNPSVSVKALVGLARLPQRFVGRPWFIWREDPELARYINNRLAEKAN